MSYFYFIDIKAIARKLFVFRIIVVSLLIILCIESLNAQTNVAHRPKIGLVLSGGGAKGFAHVGVLKVLEEAGIRVDYIGGTSMGSIIGGLYALGYSADSIQKLISHQDWPALLTDRFPRKYLSFEEKINEGKYFVPFPISDGKFQLPTSVVAGQNFEILLSRLAWNANGITDFSKLPIPFLCVATDLENGKAIVFREGSLVRCIRASMAIPTVFMPVVIDGVTMVDGGIYNNFPVEEVQKMGADIIIGVDVGFEPFKGEQLNSMLRVIEQSVFTHTVEKNYEQQLRCNVLIKPNLKSYNMMSFDKIDSVISRGEIAARLQINKLKIIADSVNKISTFEPIVKLPEHKKLKIEGIKVEGNKNTPRTYILSKFNIEVPSAVSVDEIEEGILRLNGTLLFKKVVYRFITEDNRNLIVLEVTERPESMFSVGINYNTDYRASIYLNTSWTNVFRQGSKLSLDALLGENPKINVNYFIFSGWNPSGKGPTTHGWRFDFGLNLNTSHYSLYDYTNGMRISSFNYTDISSSIYTQTIFNNSYAWGVGIQNEFCSKKADINPFNTAGSRYRFFNLYSYLKFDTYNRSYYATKGIQLNLDGRYLTQIYDKNIKPAFLVSGHYSIVIPLKSKWSLNTSLSGGITLGADTLPETYQFHAGGISTYYVKNAYPFVGQKLLEYNTLNLAIFRMDIQYEIANRHFIMARGNIGQLAGNPENLISTRNAILGYGLAYAYNSVIGPLEFTVMSSPDHKLLAYLNIGFWF